MTSTATGSAGAGERPAFALTLVRALRPRQWTKNIAVFATVHVPMVHPVFAAKALTTIDHPLASSDSQAHDLNDRGQLVASVRGGSGGVGPDVGEHAAAVPAREGSHEP